MAAALAYVGSFFAGTAGADAGAAAAAAGGAGAGAGATSAAIAAGGYTAVAGGVAEGVVPAAAAAGGAAGGATVAGTLAEASAIATGASALYTLSQGPKSINIPPMPMQGTNQIDQSVANAEQAERQRLAGAGGLQSTIGTGGGQAGSALNPATMSSHSLLGA